MKKPPARRQANHAKVREILTPEGVTLQVELADRGDRAGAVMIDLLILFGSMIVGAIGIGLLSNWANMGRVGLIIILLMIFFFRNFYFMFFELKWQGQTPGKRKLGIKVIDRFGQPLTSEAIFARNMMREIEIFVPMGILFSTGASGVSGLMQLFAFIWAAVLVCLPAMNKDNLRAGDLLAGTLVVREPKIILAKDMMEAGSRQEAEGDPAYVFSAEQLNAYGIYELQTLEALLRNMSPEGAEKRYTAGKAIIKKIGWTDPVARKEMKAFLSSYYHALRKRLEGQLLMGKRKKDKFDKQKKKPSAD